MINQKDQLLHKIVKYGYKYELTKSNNHKSKLDHYVGQYDSLLVGGSDEDRIITMNLANQIIKQTQNKIIEYINKIKDDKFKKMFNDVDDDKKTLIELLFYYGIKPSYENKLGNVSIYSDFMRESDILNKNKLKSAIDFKKLNPKNDDTNYSVYIYDIFVRFIKLLSDYISKNTDERTELLNTLMKNCMSAKKYISEVRLLLNFLNNNWTAQIVEKYYPNMKINDLYNKYESQLFKLNAPTEL